VSEALDLDFCLQQWEDTTWKRKLVACTDAQSVYDHLVRQGGLPSDKRLALDLAALREVVGAGHDSKPGHNAAAQWLPGPRNVADGLTKYPAVQDLTRAVLTSGRYTMADIAATVARAAQVKDAYRRRRRQGKPKPAPKAQPHASAPAEPGNSSKENTLGVKIA